MFAHLFRNVVSACSKRAALLVPVSGDVIASNAQNATGGISTRSLHILTGTKPAVNVQLMNVPRFLMPTTSPQLMQTCGFKVKGVVKRRCKDCYLIWQEGRLYNLCETHPRHKQMSIKKHRKATWILTHATQSKVRPW